MSEYLHTRAVDCQDCHKQPCVQCSGLLSVGSCILEEGFMLLSIAFKQAFPNQTYKSDIAILCLLQMPLVSVRIGTPESGRAAWFLIEHIEGVDYIKFAHFAEAVLLESQHIGMGKGEVHVLLKLASSDIERLFDILHLG